MAAVAAVVRVAVPLVVVAVVERERGEVARPRSELVDRRFAAFCRTCGSTRVGHTSTPFGICPLFSHRLLQG